MNFRPAPLAGAYLIDLDKKGDDRGFFARFFCVREYEKLGLDGRIVQINTSLSGEKGTLRGLHYQLAPMAETKVIRCLRGALWDVILDLREGSPTFGGHFAAELTPENRTMMYVPKGFAHGFITLKEDTETLYLATEFYSPQHERGVRWNDPKFAIPWPAKPASLSEKDANQRDFDPAWHLAAPKGC